MERTTAQCFQQNAIEVIDLTPSGTTTLCLNSGTNVKRNGWKASHEIGFWCPFLGRFHVRRPFQRPQCPHGSLSSRRWGSHEYLHPSVWLLAELITLKDPGPANALDCRSCGTNLPGYEGQWTHISPRAWSWHTSFATVAFNPIDVAVHGTLILIDDRIFRISHRTDVLLNRWYGRGFHSWFSRYFVRLSCHSPMFTEMYLLKWISH